ncbi:unnamed protein product [Polarella glacialis]|uniref:Uncharacterized protein n=1 Tax=Polarella glacialis TaxID=89957 RepID=A0A813JGT2_POLGL|nr:unnamed protein product [Polarella glacialis]
MEAEMGTEVHGGSSGSDSRAVVDEDAEEGQTNGIHSAMQPPQKIACGFYHTAAINRSRDAWTWGRNQHGVLGLDVGHQLPAAAQANRSAPVQVKAIKTDIYEVPGLNRRSQH